MNIRWSSWASRRAGRNPPTGENFKPSLLSSTLDSQLRELSGENRYPVSLLEPGVFRTHDLDGRVALEREDRHHRQEVGGVPEVELATPQRAAVSTRL